MYASALPTENEYCLPDRWHCQFLPSVATKWQYVCSLWASYKMTALADWLPDCESDKDTELAFEFSCVAL